MLYKGKDWSNVKPAGMTDAEMKRIVDLDERSVEGKADWRDNLETKALFLKARITSKIEGKRRK
jgi:hypothetical protein